ncbi:hypothetical protein C8Q73DRAFT_88045 [Cubamyces lactineus]|nr:hypothetical protein C8Q73DRAFT_88045 [Cubamyces lactineus]
MCIIIPSRWVPGSISRRVPRALRCVASSGERGEEWRGRGARARVAVLSPALSISLILYLTSPISNPRLGLRDAGWCTFRVSVSAPARLARSVAPFVSPSLVSLFLPLLPFPNLFLYPLDFLWGCMINERTNEPRTSLPFLLVCCPLFCLSLSPLCICCVCLLFAVHVACSLLLVNVACVFHSFPRVPRRFLGWFRVSVVLLALSPASLPHPLPIYRIHRILHTAHRHYP